MGYRTQVPSSLDRGRGEKRSQGEYKVKKKREERGGERISVVVLGCMHDEPFWG